MVHVVLVSGWQTVNIGDIAHSPGVLEAFRRFGKDVRLTFWAARQIDDGVRSMLARYFPDVDVIEDRVGVDGSVTPALKELFADADLLVHGSGPTLVARAELAAWRDLTGKPYGLFGITFDPLVPYHSTLDRSALMIDAIAVDMLEPADRELFDGAAFVYCRDSLTLRFLQGQGIAAPNLEFGPDATALLDVVEDDHAAELLQTFELRRGKFLCAVPRVRFTPYYQIRGYQPRVADQRKEAYNAGYVATDLDVLRQAITTWVRGTGEPVLIVPEMSYAVELARDQLIGTFPDDVAGQVRMLPRFWGVAEAAALYRQAAAVVSMECHSPLLAMAAGIPALYLRQPTDTIKGQMYADLDIPEAIVEITPTAAAEAANRVAALIDDPAAARDGTASGRERAHALYKRMVATALAAV